jgi:hypothetical protein
MPIAYRSKTRQWVKPPLGSQIDWAHPLATGLVACFLLNENGGSRVFDLANRVSLPVLSGTSWSSGFLSNANGTGVLTTCPSVLKVGVPFTFVWQGRKLGNPGNFAYLFGMNANTNGATSPFNAFLISYDSTGANVGAFFSGGATLNVFLSVAPMATSGPSQFVFSVSSSFNSPITPYLNGVRFSGSNLTGSTPQYSSTSQISFGGYSSLNSNVAHDFGLIYNTNLLAGDAEWLAAEPYSYLIPPMSTRYVFLSSSSVVSRRTLSDRAGSRGIQ